MTYLALDLRGVSILGHITRRLSKSELTLFVGMNALDLVSSITDEKENLELAAFLPIRGKELTITESDRVVFAKSIEQSILEVNMLDESMFQYIQTTGVDLTPVLHRGRTDINKTQKKMNGKWNTP